MSDQHTRNWEIEFQKYLIEHHYELYNLFQDRLHYEVDGGKIKVTLHEVEDVVLKEKNADMHKVIDAYVNEHPL